jgi:hypothetical protein
MGNQLQQTADSTTDTNADAVSAVIAESASRRGSTRKKSSSNSSKRSRDKESSSKRSKDRPPKSDRDNGLPKTGGVTNVDADTRLQLFMSGHLPLLLEDGTEHYHDPEAQRTYTLQEISDVMGVTRERVRQIEHQALKKMFAAFTSVAHSEEMNVMDWFRDLLGGMDNSESGEMSMPDV